MRLKIFQHISVKLLATSLIILALAAPSPSTSPNEVAYSYRYSVEDPKSGVITHHWEKALNGKVSGGYSFLDANGKVRVVEYVVEGDKGFKAFVTLRNPPGQFKGHLKFPTQYRKPIRLAEPVGVITPDLFVSKEEYPHIPK